MGKILIRNKNSVYDTQLIEIDESKFNETKHEKMVRVKFKKGVYAGKEQTMPLRFYNWKIHEKLKEEKSTGTTKELKDKGETK